jgi:hypothetical protein
VSLGSKYHPLENQRLSTGNGPTFAQMKVGPPSGTGTTTGTPLVVRAAGTHARTRIETGTSSVSAMTTYASPEGAWEAGIRSDGVSGSPAGAFVINDATAARAWFTGAGLTLPGLAGATTRIATINASGQVGATSWAYDGPWLSLANGGTVTGSTTFSGLYTSITTQLLLSSGAKIRTGLLDIYDNKIEASGLTHFMGSPGFQFDDGVPLAIKSGATVAGTGGSLSFDADAKFYPKRIHITSTTYTLPVVAVGETILLTFDVSACQLSTNSSQSVTWRASNGTNSFAAASTTNFDAFGYGTGTRIASAWLTGISSTRADIRG